MANRARQRTVREGQLERTLEGFNQELSLKVAESMTEFRRKYQQPTEERLDTVIEAVADMTAELEKAGGEREALGARIDGIVSDIASTRFTLGDQGIRIRENHEYGTELLQKMEILRTALNMQSETLSYLLLPWYIRLWVKVKGFFYAEAP